MTIPKFWISSLKFAFCLVFVLAGLSRPSFAANPEAADDHTLPISSLQRSALTDAQPVVSEEALMARSLDIARQMDKEGLLPKSTTAAESVSANGTNTPGDYVWMMSRAIFSSASIVYYLTHMTNPVSFESALGVGGAGFALSFGFQYATREYVNFVDYKGILRPMLDSAGKPIPATLLGTGLKELSLQVYYMAIIHLVSVMNGIEGFSSQFLVTSLFSWATEGPWSLMIAKSLGKGEASSSAWSHGKAGLAGLSLVSSLLMISNLQNSAISYYAYYVMGGIGIPLYFYKYSDWRNFVSTLGHELKSVGHKCMLALRRIKK